LGRGQASAAIERRHHGARKVTLDGKAARPLSRYFGGFNVVVFTPEDLALPRASPGDRRRFLDRGAERAAAVAEAAAARCRSPAGAANRRRGEGNPMSRNSARCEWISYLRVSTHEQAERDLSLPAQRHAVEEYAARHGVKIAREYVEAGCSGPTRTGKAFRKMLEDVLRPNSTVGTVVVHHTSRFTRDSTEARLVKQRLRKEGVRVMSVCQETTEDPIGNLIEGIFECIDQYESAGCGHHWQ
jgi:hypothetical protein